MHFCYKNKGTVTMYCVFCLMQYNEVLYAELFIFAPFCQCKYSFSSLTLRELSQYPWKFLDGIKLQRGFMFTRVLEFLHIKKGCFGDFIF